MRRKGKAGIPDRGTDPISALPDCRIRETHHGEVGESERHVHLDVNRVSIDAKDGGAPKAREHARPPARTRTVAADMNDMKRWRFPNGRRGYGRNCHLDASQ
jgi:hypothetical protein